jgi:hypothetical protein
VLSFRGLNVSYVDGLLSILHYTLRFKVFSAREPVVPSILLLLPLLNIHELSLVVGGPSASSLSLIHSFTELTLLSIHNNLSPV